MPSAKVKLPRQVTHCVICSSVIPDERKSNAKTCSLGCSRELDKTRPYKKKQERKVLNCLNCNEKIPDTKASWAITCSNKCRNQLATKKKTLNYVRKPRKISHCVICSEKIPDTRSNSAKTCSPECSEANKHTPVPRKQTHCVICSNQIPDTMKHSAVTCSSKCSYLRKKDRARRYSKVTKAVAREKQQKVLGWKNVVCKHCDKKFKGYGLNPTTCDVCIRKMKRSVGKVRLGFGSHSEYVLPTTTNPPPFTEVLNLEGETSFKDQIADFLANGGKIKRFAPQLALPSLTVLLSGNGGDDVQNGFYDQETSETRITNHELSLLLGGAVCHAS